MLSLGGLPTRRRGWQVRDTIEDAVSSFIQVQQEAVGQFSRAFKDGNGSSPAS